MKNSLFRSSGSRRRPLGFGAALAAAGLAGVLALSACASAGSASPTGAASTPGAVAGAPMMGGGGGGGVSGEIAAISGSTLQVQDASSQTAVSYTDGTTITQSVAAALADVTAGVCVTAFTGGAGGTVALDATGGADAPTPSPNATDDSGAAASVTISDAVDGTCAVGAFGMGGTPPDGGPAGAGGGATGGSGGSSDGSTGGSDGGSDGGSTGGSGGSGTAVRPTDAPEGVLPTGAPGDASGGALPAGPGGGFGGLTAGLVTAVSATGFTVQTTAADGTTSTADVTVDDSTTFTRTAKADASALTVGACVTAMGEADDKGAVVATALAVSAAGGDGCSAAVTLRGPGGGAGAGQRPAQSGATTGSGS